MTSQNTSVDVNPSAGETCKEFFAETTAHGFGQVVKQQASTSARVTWAVLILVAFVASGVHLGYLCTEYLKYGTGEKVELSDQPPTFPSVTVCNKAPLRSTYIIPLNILQYSYLNDIPINVALFENMNSTEAEDIGHEFKQMVFGCYNNSYTREKCNDDLIRLYQTSAYFNCYTIPGAYLANTISKKTGLTLNLYFNYNDRTNINWLANSDALFTGDRSEDMGARLDIHAPGTLPAPYTYGIDILAGHMTTIALTQTTRKLQPAPYGDCTKRETLPGHDEYKYDLRGCLEVCSARFINDFCNCTSGLFAAVTQPNPEKYCRKIGSVTRANQNYVRYCDGYIYRTQFDQSACDCKEPCTQDIYNPVLQRRTWPSKFGYDNLFDVIYNHTNATLLQAQLQEEIGEGLTEENTERFEKFRNQHLARVEIDFRSLLVDVKRQEPLMTLTDFLAAIGGVLGLYIGFSVLTITEFLMLPGRLIAHYVKRRQQVGSAAVDDAVSQTVTSEEFKTNIDA